MEDKQKSKKEHIPKNLCRQELTSKEYNYERDGSHIHCWLQKGKPACGIPLKDHKQCCLCDTKAPKKECKHEMAQFEYVKFCNKCNKIVMQTKNFPSKEDNLDSWDWRKLEDYFYMQFSIPSYDNLPPKERLGKKDFIEKLRAEARAEVEKEIVGMVQKMIDEELSVEPSGDIEKTAEWYKVSALKEIITNINK